MEERPPVWRVPANILNKQKRTAERGGPPTRSLDELLTIPHLKNYHITKYRLVPETCTDPLVRSKQ